MGTGRFSPTGPMTIRRHKHDAVSAGQGRVLVFGGADERDNEGVYDSVEMFEAGRFTSAEPLRIGPLQASRHHRAAWSSPDHRGYGEGQGPRPNAWIYDPAFPGRP